MIYSASTGVDCVTGTEDACLAGKADAHFLVIWIALCPRLEGIELTSMQLVEYSSKS